MRVCFPVLLAMLLVGSAAAADVQGWSDAPGWRIEAFVAGGGGCSARRPGKEMDTILAINARDRVILVAARPEWRLEPKHGLEATLAIDEAEPLAINVDPLVNLVVYQPADIALEQRLLQAKSLRWHFPWGDFTADVTGLREAIASVRQCNKRK